MLISEEKLRSVLFGTAKLTHEDGALRLWRFTDRQLEAIWHQPVSLRQVRAGASAGIHLDFVTDSEYLELSLHHFIGSSQAVCYTDVYEDGLLIAHEGYTAPEERDVSFRVPLSAGKKRVTVWFPCLFGTAVRSMVLSDGALLEPVQKKGKLLFWGDSITQGYTTAYPSRCYAALLTRAWDMECLNQAIGGAKFSEIELDDALEFRPDRIVVAYGTNDWAHGADTAKDAAFKLQALRTLYPEAAMIGILPLWRGGPLIRPGTRMPFMQMQAQLREVYQSIPGCTAVEGLELVPHDPAYFQPDVLHPNTEGFARYAGNLLRVLEKEGFR